MVSRAHLCSHHQSSSIYVWVCKTSSHHQLKNRIPPEITRSQLQCQEEHVSSSVTELFVPFVKCWVINSLGKNKALKSRWERISKRAFEWYATCQPWSVQQKTDQTPGGWISSILIRFDQTNLIVDFSDTGQMDFSFIIFVWTIILTQFTFVFIYCIWNQEINVWRISSATPDTRLFKPPNPSPPCPCPLYQSEVIGYGWRCRGVFLLYSSPGQGALVVKYHFILPVSWKEKDGESK